MQKSPLLTSLCLLDCRNMYAGARYNNAKMKQFHEAHGHSLKMSVCLITNTFIFASIFFHIFVYWIHINLKERKYINISFLYLACFFGFLLGWITSASNAYIVNRIQKIYRGIQWFPLRGYYSDYFLVYSLGEKKNEVKIYLQIKINLKLLSRFGIR